MSGTPTPPPGPNDPAVRYQIAIFNGSSSTLNLTMDSDLTVTVNYTTVVVEPIPTAPPSVNGDVNWSGSVDIVDALLVSQYYVGLNPAQFNVTAADTNCDGSVNIVDALLVARYFVGLIQVLC